ALAVRLLVDDRTLEMEFTAAGREHQVAVGVELNLGGALDGELYTAGIGSGRDGEVVLQLPVVAVIDQIDARVDTLIAHLRIGRNIPMPLRPIVPDKVVHHPRLR